MIFIISIFIALVVIASCPKIKTFVKSFTTGCKAITKLQTQRLIFSNQSVVNIYRSRIIAKFFALVFKFINNRPRFILLSKTCKVFAIGCAVPTHRKTFNVLNGVLNLVKDYTFTYFIETIAVCLALVAPHQVMVPLAQFRLKEFRFGFIHSLFPFVFSAYIGIRHITLKVLGIFLVLGSGFNLLYFTTHISRFGAMAIQPHAQRNVATWKIYARYASIHLLYAYRQHAQLRIRPIELFVVEDFAQGGFVMDFTVRRNLLFYIRLFLQLSVHNLIPPLTVTTTLPTGSQLDSLRVFLLTFHLACHA